MIGVSRETRERLDVYAALVLKWNKKINLISPSTIANLQERHISDSLQILDHLDATPARWADLGSGGGLPGLVVAAALQGDTSVALVESDARKAVFLRNAARQMGLRRVSVFNQRIESAAPQNADVVSARALAPLDQLLALVVRHMRPGGTALLPKGRGWREEIARAERHWQFQYAALPSKTDAEAVILKISRIARA